VLMVALSYRAADPGSTWMTRTILLALAALFTVTFVLLIRRSWRRALARPIPDRGVNGWLVRQPWWRLALMFWVPYGSASLGSVIGVSSHTHHHLSALRLAVVLAGSAFPAAVQAGVQGTLWRRQAERFQVGTGG